MITMRELDPAVSAHARSILELAATLQGRGTFEELDALLQALFVAAAAVELDILGLPPDDELALMRLLGGVYGALAEVSLDIMQERAHAAALARGCIAPLGEDDDDDDDDDSDGNRDGSRRRPG